MHNPDRPVVPATEGTLAPSQAASMPSPGITPTQATALAPSWSPSGGMPVQAGAQQHLTQSVNVNVGGPNIAFIQAQRGPGIFVRALWFIFFGWYLGGIWIALAYLMIIPIVTIPVFAKMINMLPQVMTLRPRNTSIQMRQQDGMTIIEESTAIQQPLWMRAVYFVLVGFWAVALWLVVAYVLSLTVIGLPIAFLMFNRAGAVATLYRN